MDTFPTPPADPAALESAAKGAAALIHETLRVMGGKLVGQLHVAERLLMGLVCEGHVLLEGLPGLAKTTAVKTLSEVSELGMKRIQFTPDLLPADIIGTQIYDPKSGDFRIKHGPIFTHLLIADEINRAPAKVQSALLEAMQERQVTIGEQTFRLASPFLVMATQNPIENEGTYPLPEAQTDRFLFKVKVGYTSIAEEEEIVRRMAGDPLPPLPKTLTMADLGAMQRLARRIHVADKVRQYIVRVVFATRDPAAHGLPELKGMVAYGASPRASISLELAAKARALFAGRAYVTPQDVKDIGRDVLRHRILRSFEAEAEQVSVDAIVDRIFERVEVP